MNSKNGSVHKTVYHCDISAQTMNKYLFEELLKFISTCDKSLTSALRCIKNRTSLRLMRLALRIAIELFQFLMFSFWERYFSSLLVLEEA